MMMIQAKRQRSSTETALVDQVPDLFDELPDDLVVCILGKLSSTAPHPSDVVSVRFTCKRLNRLGFHPSVLASAGARAFDISADRWSESAERFLRSCVAAGNVEALYTLGMIRFYCLKNRESGASLMAQAAMRSHAPSLYSLAVIHFNASGRRKDRKDLRSAAALCARAASLGHVDALRELGHCLQDGYGVRQNVAMGRRLLVQANTLELASVLPSVEPRFQMPWLHPQPHGRGLLLHVRNIQSQSQSRPPVSEGPGAVCPILSDYGCDVPAQELHPANRFLVGWFSRRAGSEAAGQELKLCCHVGCGRPETRVNEFRRCSICNKVSYCSRGCQALDWKTRHKEQCAPDPPIFDGGDGMVEGAAAVPVP